VLALDIGTDVLPALALGAEPPGRHVLDRPPTRGHLLDRALFTRAFGVLGPVEAAISLSAFLFAFTSTGWSPGEPLPGGPALAVASGTAFTAIVFGQMANAWACRSTVRPAWSIPWRSNHLLPIALSAEAGMLLAFLYVPWLAEILGQDVPSPQGFMVALLAAPAVLIADAAHKQLIRSRPRGLGRSR